MRISDWSSDVCSSDLIGIAVLGKDQCHLGQCLECIFDVELHRGRLVDRGGWNTKVGDRDVLLVELRHELLSKRTEQQHRCRKHACAAENERHWRRNGAGERRWIFLLEPEDLSDSLLPYIFGTTHRKTVRQATS